MIDYTGIKTLTYIRMGLALYLCLAVETCVISHKYHIIL